MINKLKNIISLVPYEYTGKMINEILTNNFNRNSLAQKFLPKYCVRDDGKIDNTEFYLQFSDDNKKHLLFEVLYIDPILNEEISNSGYDLFGDLNFNDILKSVKKISPYEMRACINNGVKLVFDLIYTSSADYIYGGYDCDLDIDYLGHFDENLNFLPYEIPIK